ncbi:hypothetical protein DPMN_150339 [Dreissena polymorpha]|uniref:Uncharacterized protein n=1 Tax=Dreissena polymorpha TaxID=45954 RepID=A0A9D4FG95_DREPO|nr:hypothetical protein DPMN_150339 [Dreissena polymorpha]
MLITLARDGSVLATFRDPELTYPNSVHVTPAGQVLVCYKSFNGPILQVHREGNRKLATLAQLRYGLGIMKSASVCYNSTTSSIIVGQADSILVFKVQ